MANGPLSLTANDFPPLQQTQTSFEQPKGFIEINATGLSMANNFSFENGPFVGGRGRNGPRFRDRIQGDSTCIIFIGGLDSSIPDAAIREVFGGFGQITSLARKSRNAMHDSEYAFLAFQNPQQAQCALQCREIDVMGKRLTIKPRIRSAFHQNQMSPNPHMPGNSTQRPQQQDYLRDTTNHNQARILNMKKIRQASSSPVLQPGPQDSPPRHTERIASGQNQYSSMRNAPRLLSKVLTVVNIPPEMNPYDLYHLFGGVGAVDGCYIHQWPDNYGRRYGHLMMKSFFFAQKAFENLNGFTLGDYVFEVSYKKDNEPAYVHGQESVLDYPNLPLSPPTQLLYDTVDVAGLGEHPSPPNVYHQTSVAPVQEGLDTRFIDAVNLEYSMTDNIGNTRQSKRNSQHDPNYLNPGWRPGHYSQQPPSQGFPPPPPGPGYMAGPVHSQHHGMNQGYGYDHTYQYHGYGGPPGHSQHPNMQAPGPQYYGPPHHTQFPRPPFHHSQSAGFNPVASPFNGQGFAHSFQPLTQNNISHVPVGPMPPSSSGSFSMDFPQQCSQNVEPPQFRNNTPGNVSPDAPYTVNPSSQASVANSEKTYIEEPIVIPPTDKPEDPYNLYVKNLPNDVSDAEDLKELFKEFGEITSTCLPCYDFEGPGGRKAPKGSGFVAFKKLEDAAKALEQMNQKMVRGKRLFVSYYESKGKRTERIIQIFAKTASSKGSPASSVARLASNTQGPASNPPEKDSTDSGTQPTLVVQGSPENVVVSTPRVQEPVVVSSTATPTKYAGSSPMMAKLVNGYEVVKPAVQKTASVSSSAALMPINMNVDPFDASTNQPEKEQESDGEGPKDPENSAPANSTCGCRASLAAIEEGTEENTPTLSAVPGSARSSVRGGSSRKRNVKPAAPSTPRNQSRNGSPGVSKSKLPIPAPSPKTPSASLHIPAEKKAGEDASAPSLGPLKKTNQQGQGARKPRKRKNVPKPVN